MLNNKKIAVVMPAYNAELTLQKTFQEIPLDIVDTVILVDDASSDSTAALAKSLNLIVVRHPKNRGYGGNQKTCYTEALKQHADIVVMLHPDYQYSPKLIRAMASMIAEADYDVVLGSRILGIGALSGGMPIYKFIANRCLTAFQNLLCGHKLSEYHTGYRAWNSKVLLTLPLLSNSDDFVFDNQMLAQCIWFGFSIGEVSCPTKYFSDASSINLSRSITYGLGVVKVSIQFRLAKLGILKPYFLKNDPSKLIQLS